MTLNQVRNLEAPISNDFKEDETNNDRLFDCYLYGAKYYCSQNRANNTEIVFDICEQSNVYHARTYTLGDAVKTSSGAKYGGSGSKESIIRSMLHENGFSSIQCNDDKNGFYVAANGDDQQKQLNHCFLRIYEKNRKIKLVQHWNHMYWPKTSLTRTFSPKLYKSIPFFIILMEFLFENVDSAMEQSGQEINHYNYMSVMESLQCLLLFRNYHKDEYRNHDKRNTNKNNNTSNDSLFIKCNQALSKKLAKIASGERDYWPEWSNVCYPSLSFLLLFCLAVFGDFFVF